MRNQAPMSCLLHFKQFQIEINISQVLKLFPGNNLLLNLCKLGIMPSLCMSSIELNLCSLSLERKHLLLHPKHRTMNRVHLRRVTQISQNRPKIKTISPHRCRTPVSSQHKCSITTYRWIWARSIKTLQSHSYLQCRLPNRYLEWIEKILKCQCLC